jgi:hypothetical protein
MRRREYNASCVCIVKLQYEEDKTQEKSSIKGSFHLKIVPEDKLPRKVSQELRNL